MKKIKFSNSKWFLKNNGEWIEIDEKWQDQIRFKVWEEITHGGANVPKKWQPTPDTEYQLDGIGFEIQKTKLPMTTLRSERFGTLKYQRPVLKVAHLKVEQISKDERSVRQDLFSPCE